jgi:hypothetical protein
MKTRIADLAIKAGAVTGLSLGLALGGGLDRLAAHHADENNYFVQHPGSIGGRTEIDPHDPYAPVDLSGSTMVAGDASTARTTTGQATESDGESVMPPLPTLPGRPY